MLHFHILFPFTVLHTDLLLLSFVLLYIFSFLSFFLYYKCFSPLFFPPLFFSISLLLHFLFFLFLPLFLSHLSIYFRPFTLFLSSYVDLLAFQSQVLLLKLNQFARYVLETAVWDNYQLQHLYYQNTLEKTADTSIPSAGLEYAPPLFEWFKVGHYSAEQNLFPRSHCSLCLYTPKDDTLTLPRIQPTICAVFS